MENTKHNLIFVGLMGAGKTTLGRHFARTLNLGFYDSDHEICTAAGVSVPTIFEMEGEQGFRNRESAMLEQLCCKQNIVLSTGGGAVIRENNRQCLKKGGTVIYLHTTPETLFERTRHDSNRPLLQVGNPLEKLRELYGIRDPLYRDAAHFVIESTSFAQTVKTLEDTLKSAGLFSFQTASSRLK